MQFKDEALWLKSVANNQDPYGKAVNDFAECWANLIEQEVANGKKLEDVAKDTSRAADTDGITGFMYGCAVSILSAVWLHGEQLRRWHNKETQIGTEGDAANESGGVLNPALISIG